MNFIEKWFISMINFWLNCETSWYEPSITSNINRHAHCYKCHKLDSFCIYAHHPYDDEALNCWEGFCCISHIVLIQNDFYNDFLKNLCCEMFISRAHINDSFWFIENEFCPNDDNRVVWFDIFYLNLNKADIFLANYFLQDDIFRNVFPNLYM